MRLSVLKKPLVGEVELPISKSIANRDLIIAAIAKQSILLPEQLPEDVRILQASLKSNATEVNVGMAGTAMRFLAAYFSAGQNNEVLLTGNQRMKQRPIGLLVDALKDIGADVSYTEKNGFPPLKIKGLDLAGGEVQISTEVSSQFVSALMLIAPSMKNGLTIRLVGKVLSKPYIQLTATCMRNAGVNVEFYADRISIPKGKYQVQNVLIEADWSSASYLYALACVKPGSKLLLRGLKLNSPQGDTVLADWFKPLGVTSIQKETGVEISSGGVLNYPKEIDFSSSPDLAQTFAFLTAALGEK
ncbi:MAG: 3-phosphoshikimate 1-carboxyvinyltransferase, partial [Flavobacteriales bacterium]